MHVGLPNIYPASSLLRPPATQQVQFGIGFNNNNNQSQTNFFTAAKKYTTTDRQTWVNGMLTELNKVSKDLTNKEILKPLQPNARTLLSELYDSLINKEDWNAQVPLGEGTGRITLTLKFNESNQPFLSMTTIKVNRDGSQTPSVMGEQWAKHKYSDDAVNLG